MSKPRARLAISRPMRPIPKIPNTFLERLVPLSWVGVQPFHLPLRNRSTLSVTRLAAPSSSSMPTSAQAVESTSGVLKIAIFLARAATKSM